jgi:calcineurin-like phosphoesterase family protein
MFKYKSSERNIFFCSDPHYSHKNLIKSLSTWEKGANRDFNSIAHHNDTLVNNINNTVGKDDVLFMLGDVAFGGFENVREFLSRIICNEVHLILGNHDKHIKFNRDGIKNCFTTVNTRVEVFIDDDMFVLDHYPILEWEDCWEGAYHLFGHQHNLTATRFSNGDNRSMDVGFDGHPEFRPYSLNEMYTLLKNKSYKLHH